MMLVQSIPFWVMLTMTFINLKIKKRFFCISTLSLSYLTLAMFGSIFLVLRPRTGWPYVRLDAMLYLTGCFIMLTLPALFFRDGRKNDNMEFIDLPEKIAKKIASPLIILTVPAAVYAAFIAIPDMIKFFQMGGNRGAFRNQLVDYGRGFSSLPQFLLQLGLSFSLIALFWMVYCIIFNKLDKWRIIFLAIGASGTCISALRFVNRSVLFFTLIFTIICASILYRLLPEDKRNNKGKLKKYAIAAILILIVPFMVITIARFKSDFCYSIGSYFATGPYSFNADFAARIEGKTKPLNGYLTIGCHLFIYDKIMGTNYYKEARAYFDNYYWGADSKRGTSPEIYRYYRKISGAYSGEYSTAIGCFIRDYPLILVIVLLFAFLIFFCRYFYVSKQSVAQSFLAALYFFILIQSSMFYSIRDKRGFFTLFLSVVFIISLYWIQSKINSDAKRSTAPDIDPLNKE